MKILASLTLALPSLLGCDATEATAPAVQAYTSGAEGFDTTTWWLDTGSEVVVFDAQFTPELAADKLNEIRSATDSPIRYVVITHPNPDKFNGATVFQEAGALVVASQATADAMPGVHAYKEAYFVGAGMFEAGTYPALPQVDVTFTGSKRLPLDGDTSITLHELGSPGVSSTQTVAVVGDGVIVGDLVAGGAHAWLEGGIVDGAAKPTIAGWIEALDEVEALVGPDATVYPGRGQPGPAGEVLSAQQDYLRSMDDLVAGYVAGLADPMSAFTGPDAGTHYAALTAEAEAAWPELALSYLVTYGVYGLVFDHIAQQ
jgi:glyoxylase-like metal-dependent hydrolase (beta-lactamase superfamily II)